LQLVQVIRRDVLSKFAGEVLSRLVFLLFFFYVGRKIGIVDFGTLNLVLSVTYMLGVVFLDPGLNLSTIHMLVEQQPKARVIAGSILSAKLLLFVPTLIVLGILSHGLGNRLPSFSLLFLGAVYALFNVVLEYLSSITNAFHRMDIEALLKIFNRVLIVIFGVIALRMGHVFTLLTSMVFATLLASLFAWVLLGYRLIWVIPQWHPGTVVEAFRSGLPIAGAVIVGTVYLKWDLLVLSYFNIGPEQIGWYAGSFKIVEAFSALPTILGAALFPLMVQLYKRDSDSLNRLLGLSIKAVLLFALPVAATISLLSRNVISLVYGPKFLPGAGVLAILIWCIVPMFMYFYLVFVNIAAGHAMHNLLAGCLALLVGLVANALLVPRIGYLGAAWSALAANTAFAVLATWKVCNLFKSASLPTLLIRLIAAGSAMVAAFFLIPASLSLQVLLGLLIYLTALIAFGTVGFSDLSLAMRLLALRAQPQAQQP
jgi:O-antigen/teichoic acid export membrane protein